MQMEYKGIQTNVINLDDYQSSQGNQHFSFVNLFNIPTTFISHLIIVPHGSIGVKYKQSNVFSLVLEVVGKKKKVIRDVMEHKNVKQLEIEKHCNKMN
jgi:hypothetical protein